ncbi:MAG: hypothetical protein HYR63_01795 [Proteobacteria bacterium]|nr:hypothetical protein [Pseudomonadota bacterium]
MALALSLPLSSPAVAQQGVFTPIKEAIGSLWDIVRSPFRGDVVSPPTPVSVVRGMGEGSFFWDGLKDAGYETKEITTGIGIIPDVKMSFQLVRELSDADRDDLERKIEIDESRRGGLTAVIQRQILRTLLSASNLEDLRITKLDITLLPLPAAEFVMEPKESPMSEEHDAILRAVQGHATELRGLKKRDPNAKPSAQALD